jgi:hypothetical protein
MHLSISQPASEGDPRPQGSTIGIKRFGGDVQISIHCGDEYQAIEVYERLVEAAQRGTVRLELNSVKLAPAWAR